MDPRWPHVDAGLQRRQAWLPVRGPTTTNRQPEGPLCLSVQAPSATCARSVRDLCAICARSVRDLCAICALSVRYLCAIHAQPCMKSDDTEGDESDSLFLDSRLGLRGGRTKHTRQHTRRWGAGTHVLGVLGVL
eukprot:1239647-Prymnesium_polylepis.1